MTTKYPATYSQTILSLLLIPFVLLGIVSFFVYMAFDVGWEHGNNIGKWIFGHEDEKREQDEQTGSA